MNICLAQCTDKPYIHPLSLKIYYPQRNKYQCPTYQTFYFFKNIIYETKLCDKDEFFIHFDIEMPTYSFIDMAAFLKYELHISSFNDFIQYLHKYKNKNNVQFIKRIFYYTSKIYGEKCGLLSPSFIDILKNNIPEFSDKNIQYIYDTINLKNNFFDLFRE